MDGNKKGSAAPGGNVPASVLRWFESRGVEELEAKDWQGRTLYPHTLKRKKATAKGHREDPVMLRTPTVPERAKAMVDTCRWAGRIVGWKEDLPPTIDQARAWVSRVEFDNMVIASLCAVCVREVAEPHGQFTLAAELADTYGTAAIVEVSDRLDYLLELEDPRLPVLDEEHFQRLVHAVAEAGDVGPLGVIAGHERSSFIASMASRLATFLTSSSSPPRSATTTPAAKGSPSSSASGAGTTSASPGSASE